LAKRELNLSSLIGRREEAKERRLVPEVIEDFFLQAAPFIGITVRETRAGSHVFRAGRVPRSLWPRGERLEPRFGKLGHEYARITFDKEQLKDDATLEWVTPGHPLFEAVREEAQELCGDDCTRGATFFDLHAKEPYLLDFFSASVRDGRGHVLHRRIFAVQTDNLGLMTVRQPTILLDLTPAPPETLVPLQEGRPNIEAAERILVEVALSSNEYKTAQRMKTDYWLYVVYNCGSTPEIHAIRDPVRLGWKPIVQVEHYCVRAKEILEASE
jgi:hypothetical protein